MAATEGGDLPAVLETRQSWRLDTRAVLENWENKASTDTGLRITPQDTVVPESAQVLIDQASSLLPRIKITELLMEVDEWTGLTRHFVHLKSGTQVQDKTLLL